VNTIYILGGAQTDFAKNWSKQGAGAYELLRAAIEGALTDADLAPGAIEAIQIGNFAGELFGGQGHYGGLAAMVDPAFAGLPITRHEAACASGGVSALAGMATIGAGQAEIVCVAGVEQMRNVKSQQAAEYLGAAAWVGHEATGAQYPWPHLFSQIADRYAELYELRHEHLAEIGRINFTNARRNPNAQSRDWRLTADSFSEDDQHNPVIEGRLRKHDCSRVTDGAAAIILASPGAAAEYVRKRGLPLESLPRIRGWGHTVAALPIEPKLAAAGRADYPFPLLRRAIADAYRRAGLSGPEELDGIETHDCFTISEYVAIDHFGITPPGQAWQAIEQGTITIEGSLPINPSGGLIGAGHPVGATGVRMLVDAARQVSGRAGDYQVEGAKTFGVLNIGGSLTTSVCMVVGV
jgi:acetyl-CoA C-acetyltransferase